MRTKTLLLTIAFGAAGVAASSAQVYSVNAVGYVNLAIKTGFNLVANPLNGVQNDLNTIMTLPAVADGATVYRFDPSIQNYREPISFFDGVGWLTSDPDPNALVVNPGEGFFLSSPANFNVTFVGEVPQGSLSYPVRGNNSFQILGSMVPQQLAIGSSGEANTLQFPAVDGDTVYVFDATAQSYKEPYSYFDGVGWLSANPDDTGTAGPVLAVATSCFVLKAGPLSQAWTRTFTVN